MSAAIRLSEFCHMISDALNLAFSDRAWWVLAEIKERNDKGESIYFELVEKNEEGQDIVARINANVWRREALMAFRNFEDITGKRPDRGMQVLLKVSVDYHPVYGIKLNISDIDSQHMLGQLEMQRRATIARLARDPRIRLIDGRLLTPNQQLILPKVIQRIAIITSASAAGYQDFMHTLEANEYGYRFYCKPYLTVVQGEQAAARMKEQLLKIHSEQTTEQFDAIVIIRGGGAQSDLLPFDDYQLALAVARIPIPVITGIGHLKNESIADLVANRSAKTPTEAATFILECNREFEESVCTTGELIAQLASGLLNKHQRKLDHTATILNSGTMQVISLHRNMLTRLSGRIGSGAKLELKSAGQKLQEAQRNLLPQSRRMIEDHKHEIELISERIRLLNPYDILKRGYAIVTKEKKIITHASSLKKGDQVSILMQDGEIEANVENKKQSEQ